ncbi:hypothetical protein HAX54_043429, partial [Datura stramonium]|nr:hypothetical protein [Datura stramonium]
YEMLVIVKYNNSGKGRSIFIGGTNIPVCVLLSEFRYSKVCSLQQTRYSEKWNVIGDPL